jgi:hypothetical protein
MVIGKAESDLSGEARFYTAGPIPGSFRKNKTWPMKVHMGANAKTLVLLPIPR